MRLPGRKEAHDDSLLPRNMKTFYFSTVSSFVNIIFLSFAELIGPLPFIFIRSLS